MATKKRKGKNKVTQPFQFLDLPTEIRKKIYKIVLCSFNEPPKESICRWKPDQMQNAQALGYRNIPRLGHSISTAILRASKAVHAEAYDVMVKSNRLVRISANDIAMSRIMIPAQMPVVTMNKRPIQRCQGITLHLNLSCVEEGYMGSFDNYEDKRDLLILGRDWPAFCRLLSIAEFWILKFNQQVVLGLELFPRAHEFPKYKSTLSKEFTAKAIEDLIRPFEQLRGFPNASFVGRDPYGGHISRKEADRVISQVARSAYEDPKAALRILQRHKDEGFAFFHIKDNIKASKEYTSAVTKIQTMRDGASWIDMCNTGGSKFVNSFAELYSEIYILSADNDLMTMQENPKARLPDYREMLLSLRDNCTRSLWTALDVDKEFRKYPGFSWRMSGERRAQANYKLALCWRWFADPEDADDALTAIREARQLCPDDERIRDELQTITAWKERVGDVPWSVDSLLQRLNLQFV